jgi:sulfur-carrier protein
MELHCAPFAGDLCGGDGGALKPLRVTIPSPLFSYTNRREVVADGETLAAVLLDLERQFPGLKFRMVDEQEQLRPHMRVFVGQDELRDLSTRLDASKTVHIVQALSGG